jgi:hypothetical protein
MSIDRPQRPLLDVAKELLVRKGHKAEQLSWVLEVETGHLVFLVRDAADLGSKATALIKVAGRPYLAVCRQTLDPKMSVEGKSRAKQVDLEAVAIARWIRITVLGEHAASERGSRRMQLGGEGEECPFWGKHAWLFEVARVLNQLG